MSAEKVICGPNDAAFLRDGDSAWSATNGLTKREYFAGLALQALLSTGEAQHRTSRAESAVAHADALIEALNK